MRMQSSHSMNTRKLDAYFTPKEAIVSLILIEDKYLPGIIWEPAAGNGAIVKPLQHYGYKVIVSDIKNYGLPLWRQADYLTIKCPSKVQGIVTNPPYKLAMEFIEKAIIEVNYAAFLLRTNFLESVRRLALFRKTPPARIWVSSRRLPMMHRYGYRGPKSGSNTCYAWFIWDKNSKRKRQLDWFDWQEVMEKMDG